MALRIILIFSFSLSTSISLLCQSLSGVINSYYQIVNINSPTEIEVDDASGLNTCENVLIIQMRGADIDQTNTPSFGSITDYANSGNYEFSTIQSVNGNILTLTSPLVRQYTVSGFVQLVTFPQFNNASIDGQLSCLPWDGVKGGVLALRTTGKLSVNADIDVKGKGFRGGDLISNNNWGCPPSAPNFFYAIGSFNHAAPKGEGISIIPSNIAFGRGAAANGGGGGLNVNSGGGGGGNFGFGGFGGRDWVGCAGGGTSNDWRGIGGYDIAYSNTVNKIFLGGGGGGGHAGGNQGFPSGNGGNGGGLVVIIADEIEINQNVVLDASGDDAPNISGQWSGGGGGAGGTVLLQANSFTGNATCNVQTKGGRGGNSHWPTRLGPGGGGGGGLLWISTPAVPPNILYGPVDYSGGDNGLWNNNDAWHSTPGNDGGFLFDLSIPSSFFQTMGVAEATSNSPICAGEDLFLFAEIIPSNNNSYSYVWTGPNGFSSNDQNPVIENSTINNSGEYTVVITDNTLGCSASASVNVIINPVPNLQTPDDFSVCEGDEATLTASGATSFTWDNGVVNGQPFTPSLGTTTYTVIAELNSCVSSGQVTIMVVPNQPEYTILFNDSTTLCNLSQGTITIQTNDNITWANGSSSASFTPTQPGWQQFTVSNFCNSIADSVFIAIQPAVSCDILPHSNVLCEGGSLTIVAEVNNADIFGWDDNMNNQTDITVSQSGTYQFLASNDCGSCLQNVTIENSNFQADFVGTPEQGNAPLTVQITNNSINTVSEEWFLNGDPIDLENETLIFDENGEYLLTLFAIDEDGCSSEWSQLFIVENKLVVNIPNVFTPNGDGINDFFTITINKLGSINFEILNRWGNIMQSGQIDVQPDEPVVLWDGMSIETAANDGVYFYKINFQSSFNGTSKNWHGFFHLNR